jgi:hypothetical protein
LTSTVIPGVDGNGLIGTMPKELSLQKQLKAFLTSQNNLRGNLDESFLSLSNLETIDVRGNGHLNGLVPAEVLMNNTNLKRFDISGNDFKGTIPLAIARATKLSELRLDDNELSGTVPSDNIEESWNPKE